MVLDADEFEALTGGVEEIVDTLLFEIHVLVLDELFVLSALVITVFEIKRFSLREAYKVFDFSLLFISFKDSVT